MSQDFKTLPIVTGAWCVNCMRVEHGSSTGNFHKGRPKTFF